MSLPRLMDDATRRRMWEKTILATAASPGATYKPPRAAHAEPFRPGLEMSDELARGGMPARPAPGLPGGRAGASSSARRKPVSAATWPSR